MIKCLDVQNIEEVNNVVIQSSLGKLTIKNSGWQEHVQNFFNNTLIVETQ